MVNASINTRLPGARAAQPQGDPAPLPSARAAQPQRRPSPALELLSLKARQPRYLVITPSPGARAAQPQGEPAPLPSYHPLARRSSCSASRRPSPVT
eukprot:scaffold48014_cov29-Phaeocystis_antarctica.AAC.1